jgi:hypothetical protein
MDNRSGIKQSALGEEAKLNQKVDHFFDSGNSANDPSKAGLSIH